MQIGYCKESPELTFQVLVLIAIHSDKGLMLQKLFTVLISIINSVDKTNLLLFFLKRGVI